MASLVAELRARYIWIIPAIFLAVGFYTNSHYGINWDESQHFARGSAYLHLFLTGKTDYGNLPYTPPPKGPSEYGNIRGAQQLQEKLQKNPQLTTNNFRRSYYQHDSWNGKYYLENDSGHPPLNGILAALTNYIFYQKLGIISDLDAYHMFGIILASSLVLAVGLFTRHFFGIFAGIIAQISLSLYPVFLGELHFNIKDPPEAAFYAFCVMSFAMGMTKKSWRWIILSAIFFGMALGTKFNILFAPLIIIPWLAIFLFEPLGSSISKWWISIWSKINGKIVLAFLAYPVIVLAIFFGTWPFLWQSPMENFAKIVQYYIIEGTTAVYQPAFVLANGWNSYAIKYIIWTTPLAILFLASLGITRSLYLIWRDKSHISLLVLLWLAVPILRVSYPHTTIYGGIRHIMEYIPALVILAGLGASVLLQFAHCIMAKLNILEPVKLNKVFYAVIIVAFVPTLVTMISIHPNENVYFNSIIGLKGAYQKDIPGWGSSYGNTYQQGVDWLNKYAPVNSRVGLVTGTMVNVPRIRFRSDIEFNNLSWSGPFQKGEYMMDMYYYQFPIRSYALEFLEKYLTPVYEVKVDGVTIFKIWKNDRQHTRAEYLKKTVEYPAQVSKQDDNLLLTLTEPIPLTKIDLAFSNQFCEKLANGTVYISPDGVKWESQAEPTSELQVTMDIEPKDRRLVYLFASKNAKYIKVDPRNKNSCLFTINQVRVFGFEK